MKKRILFYALFILPFLSCSQNNTEENEVNSNGIEDIVVKNGNSLLWKVEGKGIKPAYLFGTMHLINEEYYSFSENLTKRITQSDAIIMEVNGLSNPLSTFQLMSLDSGRVQDYFSKEQLIELLAFMDQELNTDPETFDKVYGGMKPFMILQAVTQKYFDETAQSYDLTIMGLAAENDIPLIGLETVEQQLGFFDQISNNEMAEMILESVRNYKKEKKEIDKLMKIYAEQRVDKLVPLFQKQSPELMQHADVFLYDRNKAWVPKLEKEMLEKTCFVAVGAGHLFGDDGLIDLLEKKGYTLTAISIE